MTIRINFYYYGEARKVSLLLLYMYKKTIGLSLLVVIAVAIPLTIALVAQRQELRQIAHGPEDHEQEKRKCYICENALYKGPCPEGKYPFTPPNSSKVECRGPNANVSCPAPCSAHIVAFCHSEENIAGQPCGILSTPTTVPTLTPSANPTPHTTPTPTLVQPTPTPISTPSPTQAPNVTPTPIPSPTSYPTSSPSPAPSNVSVLLSIKLPGIGNDGNTIPLHPMRSPQVLVFNTQNQQAKDVIAGLEFDGNIFKKEVQFTNMFQGIYYVKVKLDNTLRKLIPGTHYLSFETVATLPEVLLIFGDMDDNNSINIFDYNSFISCFGENQCSQKERADFDDNGNVNGVDYNILIRSFSTRQGD